MQNGKGKPVGFVLIDIAKILCMAVVVVCGFFIVLVIEVLRGMRR